MTQIFKNLPEEILTILRTISNKGGTGYLVGGCVRDQFFGIDSKDIDIEVFGLDQATLESILKPFGKVDTVGVSFGVTKLTTATEDYDFNLPRRERKNGTGHTGFEVEVDPTMSVYDAGLRRDLTMNAIYYNPLTKEIVDNFGGVSDIQDKILRHVSPKFAEDPLRVERLMQFAGRFEMFVADETLELCETLIPEFGTISKERHWIEFEKLMCKSKTVSYGFMALISTGWIVNYPQLDKLGLKYISAIILGSKIDTAKKVANVYGIHGVNNLAQMFATLCYNMENPLEFLGQINAPNIIQKKVEELVSIGHLLMDNKKILWEFKLALSKAKHNSLKELKTFLTIVGCNDKFLKKTLDDITEESLIPLVTGQDLLDMGFPQGKLLGLTLNDLFKLQLMQDANRERLLDYARDLLLSQV